MADLLEVEDLEVTFAGEAQAVRLDRVSFSVRQKEILCIVGESGCGKSITSLAVMGLLPVNGGVTNGRVLFEGRDLLQLSEKELDTVRGSEMTMIFQDALTSLNPVFTIGSQLTESIRAHTQIDRKHAQAQAVSLLEKVGLQDAPALMKKYPFALSGGMRQRVMIAMALACSPKLLIADEPTTALDVTIQAQIMQLLKRLQRETNMSVVLITHDIGLVAQMADRVLVMYAGQIVEQAPVPELFHHPAHPYTQALLQTVPGIHDEPGRRLASIPGSVPEAYQNITGCRFAGRCPYAQEACAAPQPMYRVTAEHAARCLRCAPEKGGEADG
ncbi:MULTISPECIES: ABC transporter ATP-binding protein [Caproicibacterium]|uniref:ABC transporter ATP-binding protein n=1 Tax=Caproicibacterium argilliputei TaxID=3030016 RepID=A0AA97D9B4_9FIRM|nr:ABC transporter ATP-binding protein [Caproicibacterium argilliputei]WOC31403.1 ABC transporter ATP-binding protein [Caproicibacterium argilliputei]